MQLLFYAGGFAPIGGIETFIHALSTILAARGHCVSMLCWGPESKLLKDIALDGVKIRRQRFRWGCRLQAPDLILATQHSIQEVLRHDVVIFTKIPPAPVLRVVRRAARIRRVRPLVYVTAYRPSEMWRNTQPKEETLNAFDTIIVQASGFASELRGLGYRGSVLTIPYVPPKISPLCDLPRPSGPVRLGFLGRLVPQKNLLYLLDVFTLLIRGTGSVEIRSPLWELHFFGDGSLRQQLVESVSARGLQEHVHFHGEIPYDSVHTAIDRCHLFAFSSVSEGQCLAALEILSRGRPIVATPVGAFPEILISPELGSFAPVDDATQFARILTQVATSLLEARVTPQTVQSRFSSIFSREDIIAKYCSFFSELADPRE